MSLLLNNNVINKVFYNNNVGYTIVGSPTIVDGIASGFVNGQNYLYTDAYTFSVANFNNCEFFWRCSTGNSALPVFSIGSNQGLWIDILQSTKKLRVKIGDINYYDFDLPSSFNTNDYFNYKLVFNNYKCSFYFGSDDLTFISEHQFETPTNLSYNNIIRIGSESWNWTSETTWSGYIDLNETYIKINGITWFNGKEQASIDVDYLALNNDIIWIKNPFNKPADWSDIRKDCPANSIALYAAHATDFSQYDNLGFTATCVGGYNVFIDGTQYGSTYSSGAKCSITWSTSGITTGDIVTTPSLLKAHKIWISPATEGNNITAFHCARVANSGREAQGTLWAHFNIDNEINLGTAFATYNSSYEPLMLSMTAKNNIIKCNKLPQFGQSSDLAAYADNIEYLPIFDLNNNTINGAVGSFNLLTTAELEKVILKNGTITGSFTSLAYNATKLKKIITKNVVLQPTFCQQAFQNNQSIEEVPDIDFTNATNLTNFITNAVALKDKVLDTRAGTGITKIGCYGTSQYFMSGFKGLRVSNEAPFNNATPPQINVSYTGMDRSALVQLFNDLPYNVGYTVVGSPTIVNGVASDCDSNNYVKTSSGNIISSSGELGFIITTQSVGTDGWSPVFTGTTSASDYSTRIEFFPGVNGGGRFRIYWPGLDLWQIYSFTLSLATKYKGVFSWTPTSITFSLQDVTNGGEIVRQTQQLSTEQSSITFVQPQFCRGNNFGTAKLDLNKTYIKVNDVYWFRGQPAMTKTLSCVGATGTADLTAEDKDIALNKGWSLTLS